MTKREKRTNWNTQDRRRFARRKKQSPVELNPALKALSQALMLGNSTSTNTITIIDNPSVITESSSLEDVLKLLTGPPLPVGYKMPRKLRSKKKRLTKKSWSK